jgi:hypothetical protein
MHSRFYLKKKDELERILQEAGFGLPSREAAHLCKALAGSAVDSEL